MQKKLILTLGQINTIMKKVLDIYLMNFYHSYKAMQVNGIITLITAIIPISISTKNNNKKTKN